jgi:hypothetical protein
MLTVSVADPGSGAFLVFDLWIRDPGLKKFGSGIENIRIRDRKYSDPG